MSPWLVFDTETTGLLLPGAAKLEDQPRIIDIAVVMVVGNEVVSEWEHLINPQLELTAEQTKHAGGITNDMLKDAPTFAELLPTVIDKFFGCRGLIAHNLPFDTGMLVNELRRINKQYAFPYPPDQLCTVAAFEHVKGRRMKMTELYQHVFGRALDQKHRALSDARALAEICTAEGLCP